MTTFFTSDTHFGHERIIELCNRPFKNTAHMDDFLVERWNAVVKPDDTVYHLGDVALGKIAESLPTVGKLNGRKILVLGNHDRPFMEAEAADHYADKGNTAKAEKHRAREEHFLTAYGEVFHTIRLHHRIPMDSLWVNLSHFPYDGDSHGEDRHKDARLPDKGRVLIHGHTHSDQKVTHSAKGSLQIHVGVDAWGYAPVSEEAVKMLIRGYTSMWDYGLKCPSCGDDPNVDCGCRRP